MTAVMDLSDIPLFALICLGIGVLELLLWVAACEVYRFLCRRKP